MNTFDRGHLLRNIPHMIAPFVVVSDMLKILVSDRHTYECTHPPRPVRTFENELNL